MTRSRAVVSVLTILLVASTTFAQPSRPLSPPGVAAAQVGGKWSEPDKDGERTYSGGKWIEVAYSRPVLRGRSSIFGKGADYGKAVSGGAPLWRAGANVTTTRDAVTRGACAPRVPHPGASMRERARRRAHANERLTRRAL